MYEQSNESEQLLGLFDKISFVFNLRVNKCASLATENSIVCFQSGKYCAEQSFKYSVMCMKAIFWLFNFEIYFLSLDHYREV